MSEIRATVFIGRDNAIPLILKDGGQALMTAYPALVPTRWAFIIHTDAGPVTIDSEDSPLAFVWDAGTSVLSLKPGPYVTDEADLSDTTLILYSAEFPNGVVMLHPTDTASKLRVNVNDED